jgi:alpha-galactosidase
LRCTKLIIRNVPGPQQEGHCARGLSLQMGLALALLSLHAAATALSNGHPLPALGWSSWNTFQGAVSDALLREVADAIVSSGLRDAGMRFLNLDDGWAVGRLPNGTIVPDPALFPDGIAPLAAYINGLGLSMGIYTARGSTTCMGRPGSNNYEALDAQTYADWGISYLKEDSCGGATNGTVWEQYARMRDGLNATGRSIYFSITEALPYTDGHPAMHCYGPNVFTLFPWLQQGLDPTTLANSYLVEYCNNEPSFGSTAGFPTPGGLLSQLDSQALLTLDNLTVPGAFNDPDMLDVCNAGLTPTEWRSEFSLWSILASPLILGNDPRSMGADCIEVVTNRDVIAVDQDPLVIRGTLVYQWPDAVWPNTTGTAPPTSAPAAVPVAATAAARVAGRAAAAPNMEAGLGMAPCNASAPEQLWTAQLNATGYGLIESAAPTYSGLCLTYGGYRESNTFLGDCTNWSLPGIGSQRWSAPPVGVTSFTALSVQDNAGKVLDVYDCNVTASQPVQVCTQGGADCYSPSGAPAGCGSTNQAFTFASTATGAPAPIVSAVSDTTKGPFCVAAAPLPAGPVDIRMQVWTKPLADGSVAVLAFNRHPFLAYNVTVSWALVHLAPGPGGVNVTDLWAQSSAVVPAAAGGVTPTVQPHDVWMARMWPAA